MSPIRSRRRFFARLAIELGIGVVVAISSSQAAFSASAGDVLQPKTEIDAPASDSELIPTLRGHAFARNTIIDFPFSNSLASWNFVAADDRGEVGINGQIGIGRLGVILGAQSMTFLSAEDQQRYGGGFSTGLRYEAVKTDQWLVTPAVFYTWAMSGQNQHDQFLSITYRATSHVVQPSLLSAISISPLVGITPELALRFENTSASPGTDLITTPTTSALAGGTLDFRSNSDSACPLDLQGSALEQLGLEGGFNSIFQAGVGVFFRIKRDEDLGAELQQRIDSSLTDTALAVSANAYF